MRVICRADLNLLAIQSRQFVPRRGPNRAMGEQMKAMMVDGVKVIKLDETHEDEKNRQSDALSMFRIWSLLTGEDQMRDLTVANKVHR